MAVLLSAVVLEEPGDDQVILTFTVDTLGKADFGDSPSVAGRAPRADRGHQVVVARLKFTPGVVAR